MFGIFLGADKAGNILQTNVTGQRQVPKSIRKMEIYSVSQLNVPFF